MSLTSEYQDMVNNLHLFCPAFDYIIEQNEDGSPVDYDNAPFVPVPTGKPCPGWFVSDFDTVHQCPNHPGKPNPYLED